jgi:DeoR family suf operon transcriptional repressor
VREQKGTEGLVELFRAQWERIASDATGELAQLPLSERTQLLAELLSSHGYMAEATPLAGSDEALIREHNCVLRAVAERFPEVCVAEEKFLSEFLGAVVERRKHIAAGASCCEYCVKTGDGRRATGDGDPAQDGTGLQASTSKSNTHE